MNNPHNQPDENIEEKFLNRRQKIFIVSALVFFVTVLHYLIEVSDRGKGVDKSISEKIFEPFITGKSKGTGLGLSISKKIVEAHAGKLAYRNNIDAGTTFWISIPTGH
jgi:signal transduction histidine kinase